MTEYVSTVKPYDKDCYHTNPDCTRLKNGCMPIEDSSQSVETLDICSECANEIDDFHYTLKECPKCGEQFKNVPNHLPCE